MENASDHGWALALVQRMLGVDRDLAHFDLAAARLQWLRQLARRMHGVKPPRYPTLWEAFVNTIAFQQVSLQAASAIARRLIVASGHPVEREGVRLYPFPSVEQVLGATQRARSISSTTHRLKLGRCRSAIGCELLLRLETPRWRSKLIGSIS